ncbi:tetraspanin-18-like [Styela clava]|uniref:tetraspanin-18-like n=1 Tax=Styela clava TaxID=7725 RepID=UPI001939FA6A|nr:tetraspanin-18-like [Styela clava]
MGCGMTLIKYMMFFVNFLIFLAGAAMLAVGIWVVVDADSFKNMVSSDPAIFSGIYIIIAIGAAVFLIGFLGCCGAIKESRCLLGTFFAIILVLFLIQLVGAILAIVYRSKSMDLIREQMDDYKTDADVKKGWDELHTEFKCCGIDGPGDWGKDIPKSCCAGMPQKCNVTLAYEHGCSNSISKMFWILSGISLGILLIELLAMVFSCCLYQKIGKAE